MFLLFNKITSQPKYVKMYFDGSTVFKKMFVQSKRCYNVRFLFG